MESGLLPRPKLLKSKVNILHRKKERKEVRKERYDVVETQDCWFQARRLALAWLTAAL